MLRLPADAPLRGLPIWSSGLVRRCARCRHLLPVESFNRLGAGRQHYCRSCFRSYHREHRDVHGRLGRAAARRRVAQARRHVAARLAGASCADCGERDPVVLEFDHVADKQANVADLVGMGRSPERIDGEIARCQIVCANCHRLRTAGRAAWTRGSPDRRSALTRFPPAVARDLALAFDALEASGCTDCGHAVMAALDFDHVGLKRFDVMRAAWRGAPADEVLTEIAACVVRCANCHRRVTAQRRAHPS